MFSFALCMDFVVSFVGQGMMFADYVFLVK